MNIGSSHNSVGIAVAAIVAIVVVVPTVVFVAAEYRHVRLVENDSEQIVVNTAGIFKRVLGNIDFSATPFDHKYERIDQVSHDADIDDRSERRKIDDHVVVALAQAAE